MIRIGSSTIKRTHACEDNEERRVRAQAREYDAAEAAAFHAAQGPPVSGCDRVHELVYAQADGPLSAKPRFRSKQL